MRSPSQTFAATLVAITFLAASCGDESDPESATKDTLPTVVVTTNILGDVVERLAGDEFEVVTLMPVGTDPHDFQASAQQVVQIDEADAVIVNGAEFEEGLLDVIESAAADGVPIFETIESVPTVEFGDKEEEHDEEGHSAEEEHHDHEGIDPHFFTDPARMALAADGIGAFLAKTIDDVDTEALETNTAEYVAEIEALDTEVETTLEKIPADKRVLITNHEVFGYFADRYEFEIAGTIIPSGSTADGTDAQALAELAEKIKDEDVPAVFADTSSSDQLANTLSDEVGDIAVVELFSESLGDEDSDGATYIEMVRTNAERITGALAG